MKESVQTVHSKPQSKGLNLGAKQTKISEPVTNPNPSIVSSDWPQFEPEKKEEIPQDTKKIPKPKQIEKKASDKLAENDFDKIFDSPSFFPE